MNVTRTLTHKKEGAATKMKNSNCCADEQVGAGDPERAARLTVLPLNARDAGATHRLHEPRMAPCVKKEDSTTGKKPWSSSEEHVFPHEFIAFQKQACAARVPSWDFGRRTIVANGSSS